ncbi:TetR/AcrR family transcriptional regulator [Staphylococcus succinus]|jgi:AcrR family transcriptional regulator|uniref:TetR/AcrR family transcriptional regulator n=1 Tax=Staphylococcus succinus TaxID=61015 RepID=A0A9Q6MWQ0_9STAP|nr:TetR/AcrR family transcriptional regulator [Staphylococcus succinus]MEB8127325.1 TetR/AcrR family transcriptional regulator [Staphylococcus succinus]MEB8210165.1 TetR/AcrR family transcriptional regulator [Staphylococcus succinus]PTI68694.1 TetR/AcrR family transcriptional regulator [Staphylococcus succinus]PTI77491.1 TetR/AcrR family transcriptional regulator [Staphylococcus succinus]PTJ20339.1 TetR/AcrR family transcriptional regulator [Staphylococcus succinus]
MNENDLRVIKTKRALSQSFYKLLENKLFSTITVNQICDDALIHRTTFYKHFYDKYDLLIYLITDLTKDFFSSNFKERINNPFTTIENTMNNLDELKRIADKQKEDQAFERTIANHFIRILQTDIKENEHRITIDSSVPTELILYVYGASLFGFMEWIRDHCINLPAKDIDELFHKMINIHVKDE